MKSYIVLLVVLLSSLSTFAGAQPSEVKHLYLPVSIIQDTDFDYEKLDSIDELEPPFPAESSFMIGDLPVKSGKFTIYKFISCYMATGHESSESSIFHDLLAVKTDKDGTIADAYHYTLEWQDTPSLRLYKMQAKDIKLSRYLALQNLKLVNVTGEKLEKEGILDDYYQSKHLFAKAKEVEAVTLILNPDLLRQDADQIVYEPDSRIKKASYTSYIFQQQEFEKKVGKFPLTEQKTIKVNITRTESNRHVPDANMQSPSDGFELISNYCTILP